MASFLRVDGEERELSAARLVWHRAHAADGDGIAFNLIAHGGPRLLHVGGWLPGADPAELSCGELLLDDPGPDAALDGRLFRMLLVRFGRVSAERAVLSLDGEIEDIDVGSESLTTVAADLVCVVEREQVPAYCHGCGTSLDGAEREVHEFAGGRLVTSHRPFPLCPDCAAAPPSPLPLHCPSCGVAYEPSGVLAQADEHTVAYTSTCPAGHVVSGRSAVAD